MSAEWVTALATLGTFIVITASAFAALLQLRHMRGSTQIAAITESRETLESEAFRKAQHFVSYELPLRLADPEEARRIAHLPFVDEYEAIGTVANFFESMGLFVKRGVIDKDTACDVLSYVVLRNWHALLPVTTYARAVLDEPRLWENFEYLAALSERYNAENRETYPKHMEHMPADRSLIELVERSE